MTGFLINGDESITASGEGYHDYNWHYIYSPFVQHSWYWCNFNEDALVITWAEIMKNIFSSGTMIVVNPNEMNSFLINLEDVIFSGCEYMFKNRRYIPRTFSLKIDSEPLYVDVKMETLNTHYVRLPFMRYWRYHLRVVGTIVYNDTVEEINIVQIANIMRFFK